MTATDVVVVGCGVLGAWTARALRAAGLGVTVVDVSTPGHPAAASGGESRIVRCMYGSETLYTQWAAGSMADWHALSDRSNGTLFHPTGVLWLHRENDSFAAASRAALEAEGIPVESLGPNELRRFHPLLEVTDEDRGLFEPGGGAVRAAAAVQAIVDELVADGVRVVRERIDPIRETDGAGGRLTAVRAASGETFTADRFVVAAGAWLDRICPDAMAGRLFVTRQEVLFFDVAPDVSGDLPVWADMPFYGFPPIAGRGFKIASDLHGPTVTDLDAMPRDVGREAVDAARDFLSRRFPSLADAPFVEGRVCQYANSWNGDFLVDVHPGLANVWLAGCGSGHGYKHGPAFGAHVAGRLLGTEAPIPRFSLAAKRREQRRSIQ